MSITRRTRGGSPSRFYGDHFATLPFGMMGLLDFPTACGQPETFFVIGELLLRACIG